MKIGFGIICFVLVCFLNACETNKSAPKRLAINPQSPKEEKIKELNKPIFCLSVIIPNFPKLERRAIGTGFLVWENLIATAFHVNKDLDSIISSNSIPNKKIIAWKKFEDGEILEIPLKLIASDQNSDLALFSFDTENIQPQFQKRDIKPFQLADRLPDLGEDILSVGYYNLMEFPFNSLGNVSTIEKDEDIYSDVTLMPGNSGSPLVSMKTGEVLGVNIKVMTMGDGTIRLGIAKRISKLSELMGKVNP
ncbi:MAG TPA: serine protease [Pyrinomonadaceae bacterium]|nr:serine protease [Pyrinomonadaceae bacterium]